VNAILKLRNLRIKELDQGPRGIYSSGFLFDGGERETVNYVPSQTQKQKPFLYKGGQRY
jgi:hypothetical protein